MSYAKGKPALKFVIHRPMNQPDYTVIIADGEPLDGTFDSATKTFKIAPHYRDFQEEYTPDFLNHELQNGTVRRKLRGFWYKAKILFEGMPGQLAHHLRYMMNRNEHTTIDFYPSYVSHPNYKEVVTIDDESIKFYYFNIRADAQKEFNLHLLGTVRRADVPELSSTFTSWANDHLLIGEISETFNSLL